MLWTRQLLSLPESLFRWKEAEPWTQQNPRLASESHQQQPPSRKQLHSFEARTCIQNAQKGIYHHKIWGTFGVGSQIVKLCKSLTKDFVLLTCITKADGHVLPRVNFSTIPLKQYSVLRQFGRTSRLIIRDWSHLDHHGSCDSCKWPTPSWPLVLSPHASSLQDRINRPSGKRTMAVDGLVVFTHPLERCSSIGIVPFILESSRHQATPKVPK